MKKSHQELEEEYKENLEQTKEFWINDYYGGDVLEEIDNVRYNLGLSEYIDQYEYEQEQEEKLEE